MMMMMIHHSEHQGRYDTMPLHIQLPTVVWIHTCMYTKNEHRPNSLFREVLQIVFHQCPMPSSCPRASAAECAACRCSLWW